MKLVISLWLNTAGESSSMFRKSKADDATLCLASNNRQLFDDRLIWLGLSSEREREKLPVSLAASSSNTWFNFLLTLLLLDASKPSHLERLPERCLVTLSALLHFRVSVIWDVSSSFFPMSFWLLTKLSLWAVAVPNTSPWASCTEYFVLCSGIWLQFWDLSCERWQTYL